MAIYNDGYLKEHGSILITSRLARLIVLEWWYKKVKDMPCPPASEFYRNVQEGVIRVFDELINDIKLSLGMTPHPELTIGEHCGDEKRQKEDTWNIMTEEEMKAEMVIREYEMLQEDASLFDSDQDTEDEDDDDQEGSENKQEWEDEEEDRTRTSL